ncbi:hypothetical protein [Inquilinus sp. Marseille-Q2685]|uniref:hypothetical protein n=1 Tax=Inquilinus sp. Marseille-Q2685 TaxID=2866581 RepID=UPI001CE41D85|nr:hypothetical protein [Inquilinus sp. Marseille-Q2685]
MQRYINAIEASLSSENWYAALGIALMMPDVCSGLEEGYGRGRSRYIEWFDTYMLRKYTYNHAISGPIIFLNGRNCYALRCAYLHQGSEDLSQHEVRENLDRIKFTTSGTHCGRINNLLILNVHEFCRDICESVREWILNRMSIDPKIQERARDLIGFGDGFVLSGTQTSARP